MRKRTTQADRSAGAGAEENARGRLPSRQTNRSGSAIRRMSEAKMSTGARTDEGIASRLAAVEILYRVDQESAYADVLLGQRLPDFAPADRRLITRLVLGTLAWRGRLDYELAHLTTRKLDATQPAALAIMRLGLFQLRFLDPDSAARRRRYRRQPRQTNSRSAQGVGLRQCRHAPRDA